MTAPPSCPWAPGQAAGDRVTPVGTAWPPPATEQDKRGQQQPQPFIGVRAPRAGPGPCTAQAGGARPGDSAWGQRLGTAPGPQGRGQGLGTAPRSPSPPREGDPALEAPLCKAQSSPVQSRGCWWPEGLTQATRGRATFRVAAVPQGTAGDTAAMGKRPLPAPVSLSVCQSVCGSSCSSPAP